jgi:hypothetical protein
LQYSVAFLGDVDGDNQDELVVVRIDSATQEVATLIFGPGGTTAVAVQDLMAASVGAGVLLSWKLTEDPGRELLGIHVQRAAEVQGPYHSITLALLDAARSMSFEDLGVEPGQTAWYRLLLVRREGTSATTGPVGVVHGAGRAEVELRVVHGPGDSGPVAVTYRVPRAEARVRLGIYDVLGRRVRLLDEGPRSAGQWQRTWDRLDDAGRPVARGVYVLQLETAELTLSRKLVLSSR